MAELFDKDQSVIARHISNVFKEGGNMQILHNTLSKFKPTQVYSLDVIISAGYRVKSKRGTQFRVWANKVLKQYLLEVRIYIRRWKRRLPCSSISSPRITPSATATNALRPLFSYSFSIATAFYTEKTALSA